MFYLAFGRLGYNPGASTAVWQREFARRFGAAASAVEAAYRSASRITPLLVAARLPSASEFGYWAELDTGGSLEAYMCIPPSDTAQFYAIKSFRKVEGTRDRWQSDIPGYVADAVAGEMRAKWTPFQIAERLHWLAGRRWQRSHRPNRPSVNRPAPSSAPRNWTCAFWPTWQRITPRS